MQQDSRQARRSGNRAAILAWCLMACCAGTTAQTIQWSVGPLASDVQSASLEFGSSGAGSHAGAPPDSVFAATRRIAFAADRVIVAVRLSSDASNPGWRLLSLDLKTGAVRDQRDLANFALRAIFATADAHVIVSGGSVLRLTANLKDDGALDFAASGHGQGRVENISPDGSTLGLAARPGFELVDARTLRLTSLTTDGAVDTAVNRSGFITDSIRWGADYPRDSSFITYTDARGQFMVYHGHCGARPEFITDSLIYEPGCRVPLILDTGGNIVKVIVQKGELTQKGEFTFAGASQNGSRFALRTGKYDAKHDRVSEKFVIFSTETMKSIAEIEPPEPSEVQSWSAFSPDGSMFVAGSPRILALYRLP